MACLYQRRETSFLRLQPPTRSPPNHCSLEIHTSLLDKTLSPPPAARPAPILPCPPRSPLSRAAARDSPNAETPAHRSQNPDKCLRGRTPAKSRSNHPDGSEKTSA